MTQRVYTVIASIAPAPTQIKKGRDQFGSSPQRGVTHERAEEVEKPRSCAQPAPLLHFIALETDSGNKLSLRPNTLFR